MEHIHLVFIYDIAMEELMVRTVQSKNKDNHCNSGFRCFADLQTFRSWVLGKPEVWKNKKELLRWICHHVLGGLASVGYKTLPCLLTGYAWSDPGNRHILAYFYGRCYN